MHDSYPTPVLAREARTEIEMAATTGRTRLRQWHPAAGLSDPMVEKMRGPKLVLVWAVLILLSWAGALLLGYGAYSVVTALF